MSMQEIRVICRFCCTGLVLALSSTCFAGGKNAAVDQAGYLPLASKFVEVASGADSFAVIDVRTGTAVFTSALHTRTLTDAATGKLVKEGDFSLLQTSGEYRVVTSAQDSSERFFISDTVYNQAYKKSLKGFYYQRCGIALLQPYAGVYSHAQCHTLDGLFHTSTDTTGFRFVTGGWHDAGDYGKYVVNAGVTVGTLLMAYEYFPERFSQDNTLIPESGNGVPDILDEVRYELDWFLKMQGPNGGVYCKLTKPQFEGFVMPNSDTGTRYIYQITSAATGDFAAVMARAARVYAAFDTAFSRRCLDAAEHAWTYLSANPSIVPAGGFHNPSGTATGEYGDGDDFDERLWAAAELFVTTGEDTYNNFYAPYYSTAGLFGGPMGWPSVGPMAHLTYLFCTRAGASTIIQDDLRQSLASFCQTFTARRDASGFRSAMRSQDYYWGSNSTVLNIAILLIMGHRQNPAGGYLDAAADQLHYILGTNAHLLSFVTGIGARSPRQPHHRPSASDGIADPVPGLLAGGPNRNVTQDPVLNSLFTASTPAALCYADQQGSFASNEIAINWNAPLVFVAGYFNGALTASVGQQQGSLHEERFNLMQNYPNPFNGATQISFSLDRQEQLDFKVVDVLGRTVLKKSLGMCAPGEHRFLWRAADEYGAPLSSGIYFYFLSGEHRSPVKKLILLN